MSKYYLQEKITATGLLYRNSSGIIQGISLSESPTAGSVPQRSSSGTLKTSAPTSANDAATKKYVDDQMEDGVLRNVKRIEFAGGKYCISAGTSYLDPAITTPPSGMPNEPLCTLNQSPKYMRSLITNWQSSWCFIKGTFITMADGSMKAIENIVAGDHVASIDLNTKQLKETIVMYCGTDGVYTNDFKNIRLCNGTIITVHGNEQFYDPDRHMIVGMDHFKPTQKFMLEDGSIDSLSDIDDFQTVTPELYYSIFTTDCLFIVNGVLAGHALKRQAKRFLKLPNTPPDSVMSILNRVQTIYENRKKYTDEREFTLASGHVRQTMLDAEQMVSHLKSQIAATDYWVLKRTEGLIDDYEWEQMKSERAEWRVKINDEQDIYNAARDEYETIKRHYLINPMTSEEAFAECYPKIIEAERMLFAAIEHGEYEF